MSPFVSLSAKFHKNYTVFRTNFAFDWRKRGTLQLYR
jgi:hypothetical protein